MTDSSPGLPALAEIDFALRRTTEFLASELAAPTNEAPPWSDFEWRIARAVCALQGISTLLLSRLRWNGPSGWRRFLEEQRRQSILRHIEIARLLEAIANRAHHDGVMLVPLKGAALYRKGIYISGERPMGDIDLLVRSEDAQSVARLLDACGYEPAFATRRHEVFEPILKTTSAGVAGEHIDNPIKIEVHTKIAEQLPVASVDITEYLFASTMKPGLNEYPSTASLLLHLLLHVAGNMRARALRLIQLHDVALLTSRMEDDDWDEFFAMRRTDRSFWWVWPSLSMTSRYYPTAFESAIFERRGSKYPWLLSHLVRGQRLSDISWSNIRIAALPGVEWSRTPFEALLFIKSRAWPSRRARLELSESAAQIPGGAAVPWYGISHGARILRWIVSRPPRVQTLLAVRAALAQE